eukprot:SAG11_NODE_1664_length_4496_cov_1.786218_4_plen_223_part_00
MRSVSLSDACNIQMVLLSGTEFSWTVEQWESIDLYGYIAPISVPVETGPQTGGGLGSSGTEAREAGSGSGVGGVGTSSYQLPSARDRNAIAGIGGLTLEQVAFAIPSVEREAGTSYLLETVSSMMRHGVPAGRILVMKAGDQAAPHPAYDRLLANKSYSVVGVEPYGEGTAAQRLWQNARTFLESGVDFVENLPLSTRWRILVRNVSWQLSRPFRHQHALAY